MKTMFKRLLFILAVAAVLCSCSDFGSSNNGGGVTVKRVASIVCADGGVIAYTHDTYGRITSIVCTGGANDGKRYDIGYPFGVAVITVSDGTSEWSMNFNNYYLLASWMLKESETEKELSSFDYLYAGYMNTAFLINVTDNLTGGVSSFSWRQNVIAQQVNKIDPEHSTTINYDYDSMAANFMATVNLFMLLIPEYTENMNMDPLVASAISVFGYRSSYLPTKVSLSSNYDDTDDDGDDEDAPETAAESSEVRIFSYDFDNEGTVYSIYSGSGDERTKLYEIKYEYASDKTE